MDATKQEKRILYATFFGIFMVCLCVCMVFAKMPGYSNFQPRMRVNRTASMTITTTWTKVDFSGTSTYNVNTFGLDPTTGNPLVYWDATNKIFKFYNTADLNYILMYSGQESCTLLTTPVTLRMRVTIPNGVSPGVDIHFPNPDGTGYMDVCPAAYISSQSFANPLPVYINQAIRTNGFYIEVALSNGTLGTVTVDNQSLLIQATAYQN